MTGTASAAPLAKILCQYVRMADYDLTRLSELGERYERLRAEVDEVRVALADEIEAAEKAKVRQVYIVKASRLTRERIRQMRIARQATAKKTTGRTSSGR